MTNAKTFRKSLLPASKNMNPSEPAVLSCCQPASEAPETPALETTNRDRSWIEIELVDETDRPVARERYRITLADGRTLLEGKTNSNGEARITGIDPGICKVTFPDLDADAWEKT